MLMRLCLKAMEEKQALLESRVMWVFLVAGESQARKDRLVCMDLEDQQEFREKMEDKGCKVKLARLASLVLQDSRG